MAVKFPAGAAVSGLLLLLLLISILPASAHNITRILSTNPNFSSFNSLLSSTDLAADINRRRTITVLAVSDAAAANLTAFTPDVLRRILSVHVILDYFDLDKLENLNKRSTIVTTLFQASGEAEGLAGFLNVTKSGDGGVVFGSAAAGAVANSDLVGSVAARPYNISVLQVSSVIIPPGIAGEKSPPPSPAAANAPVSGKGNATEPSKAPSPAADAPVTEAAAPAPAADAPAADAPAADNPATDAPAADSPAADSPAGALEGESPAADSPEGEADVDNSGGERVIGAGLGVIVGAVLLAWL